MTTRVSRTTTASRRLVRLSPSFETIYNFDHHRLMHRRQMVVKCRVFWFYAEIARCFRPSEDFCGVTPFRGDRKLPRFHAFTRHRLVIACGFATGIHGRWSLEDKVAKAQRCASALDAGESAGPVIPRLYGRIDFVARLRSRRAGEQTGNTASDSINERLSGIKGQRRYEYERIRCC